MEVPSALIVLFPNIILLFLSFSRSFSSTIKNRIKFCARFAIAIPSLRAKEIQNCRKLHQSDCTVYLDIQSLMLKN